MSESIAPAPREHGWTRLVLALAAFVLLPAVGELRAAPILAQLAAVLPVSSTIALLAPLLAVCFLAAWREGGRWWTAVVWTAIAALIVVAATRSVGTAYADFVRGWALLVAAAFGMACLAARGGRLFGRAVSATGVALVIGLATLFVYRVSLTSVTDVFARHYDEENRLSAAVLDAVAARAPWLQSWWVFPTEAWLPRLSALAEVLFPALLALEALTACALAWALYHRLSRVRLGAPLGPLRTFRFSDQLIWGLVVGVTMMLLPSLGDFRALGLNLVVFFGALYSLRGLGVMAWLLDRRGGRAVTLVGAAIAIVLGWITLGAAFAIGVGDTWANWRRLDAPGSVTRGSP